MCFFIGGLQLGDIYSLIICVASITYRGFQLKTFLIFLNQYRKLNRIEFHDIKYVKLKCFFSMNGMITRKKGRMPIQTREDIKHHGV